MLSFSFSALLLAASLSNALPSVSKRQSPDTTWNDRFLPQPINFKYHEAGECEYQVAYERFSYDNRYDVQYIAEYPDGSQAQLNPISGTLARDNVWLVDGLPEARALQVAFFDNACRSGQSPQSFRANFLLRSGFTYENDYTTGSIPITSAVLPPVPQNVRVQAAQRSSTVTWSPVEGASGYVVLVEWLVNSEIGFIPFVWAREVGAEETSFTYNRKFTRASVVTIGQQEKAFSALDTAYDVRA